MGTLRVVDPGQYTLFRSVERPHVCCTPDRLVYDGDTLVAALELKTAHFESGKEWGERVPLAYQIQLQTAMYVLGVDHGYFAVLVDGYKFRWHSMKRNQRFIAKMLARLDAFWASIERGEYPNVDGSEATAQALARRFGNPTPDRVDLPLEMEALGQQYDAVLATEREAEATKLAIQNRVKEALGNHAIGVLMDGTGFAWKANGKGRRFTRVTKVNTDG